MDVAISFVRCMHVCRIRISTTVKSLYNATKLDAVSTFSALYAERGHQLQENLHTVLEKGENIHFSALYAKQRYELEQYLNTDPNIRFHIHFSCVICKTRLWTMRNLPRVQEIRTRHPFFPCMQKDRLQIRKICPQCRKCVDFFWEFWRTFWNKSKQREAAIHTLYDKVDAESNFSYVCKRSTGFIRFRRTVYGRGRNFALTADVSKADSSIYGIPQTFESVKNIYQYYECSNRAI